VIGVQKNRGAEALSLITYHLSRINKLYFPAMTAAPEELIVGLVSISDRASQGVYKDEGIPALEEWLSKAVAAPAVRIVKRLIPDERPAIETALRPATSPPRQRSPSPTR
jgi:hypothetical protein